ncbi:AlbA family DNA-binding domain-containing protein [Halanaerobium kushneri]|uniref:Putative DNA-binding domain-containing protein n=1 Tax=Halanaerobium kushneri TaxID=56779 RepID=A0A1N6PH03_9FIRM|nr:ATP-binding protein [Halanaerobium kushneri]SIQ03621.1 Putative DNA-binding domain-containing protein [Halanaerobium kushneri]
MTDIRKGINEILAQFLEDPSREDLKELFMSHLGETNSLDFKESWPEKSKMARHVLAFANSGGGCILFGVTDDYDNIGLSEYKDEATFKDEVEGYVPNRVISKDIVIINFNFEDAGYQEIEGDKFQVLIIEDDPNYIPFISKENGSSIKKNAIYTRKGTTSVESSYEDLQGMISRKIKSGYTTSLELDDEMNQLKLLYSNIDEYYRYNVLENLSDVFTSSGLIQHRQENPHFPEESFDEFVSRMIDGKKEKIEKMLGLK